MLYSAFIHFLIVAGTPVTKLKAGIIVFSFIIAPAAIIHDSPIMQPFKITAFVPM